MLDQGKFAKTLQHILELLLSGRYVELEQFTKGIRLSARELETVVKEYSQKLAFPPKEHLRHLDVIEITDSTPQQWCVDVGLWTDDGQQSDLSLSLTLINSNTEIYDVEIDDLHVL